GPVGDDAVAGMRRQPDAAAHHDAVHEGYIRFWKFGDAGVENVLLSPQDFSEIAADLRTLIERADIAAGAQAALAGAFQQDQADRGIGLEAIQRLIDVPEHLQRHGIDGLRPVEPDDPGAAFAPRNQVGLSHSGWRSHRAPSISLRATISRMISLVPSRI